MDATVTPVQAVQTTYLDRMKQFGYERTARTHDECGHKADSHGAQRKGTQDHMADEQFPAALTALEEYRNIEQQMAQPEAASNPDTMRKLGRRHAQLSGIVTAYQQYRALADDLEAAREMAADDADFAAEAKRLEDKLTQDHMADEQFPAALTALEEYRNIEQQMAQPEAASNPDTMRKLGRRHAQLAGIVTAYRQYRARADDLEAARAMATDDADFAAEAKRLEDELPAAQERLRTALIPRDPDDARDVIMEIKAGTGGEEAALFAGDLLRMYTRYAEKRGWSVTVQSENATELGGVKDVCARRDHGDQGRHRRRRGRAVRRRPAAHVHALRRKARVERDCAKRERDRARRRQRRTARDPRQRHARTGRRRVGVAQI